VLISKKTHCGRCDGGMQRVGLTRLVLTPTVTFCTYRCDRCGVHTLIQNVDRMPPLGCVFQLSADAAKTILEPVPAV